MSSLRLAIEEWTALLGPDGVLPAHQAEARYAGHARRRIPAALLPARADDVQAIVRIAARHRVSLHPVSTGRNWGYGGASPACDHCVMLDLSRMDRIIALDAELGTVTIEPGVTQGQLRRHLDQLGLDFMVPTTGAGPSASLLGNALERGYGITPHADHFAAVTSLQAVLPDGNLYRPRLATLGGEQVARAYKWGVGPYLDGLFAQSNFGVVTQMTIALAKRPAHVEAFYVFLDKGEQLEPALRALRDLLRSMGGLMGGVNIINGYRLASMACPADARGRDGPLQAEQLAQVLRQHGLGAYMIMGSVYGEPSVARAAVAVVKRAFSACSRQRTSLTRRKAEALQRLAGWFPRATARFGLSQEKARSMLSALNLMEGVPDEIALRLVHWKSSDPLPERLSASLESGEQGLIWYAPLVPALPRTVLAFQEMVTRVCLAHGFEPLMTLTTLSDRCFDSSVPLLFDSRCPAQAACAQRCFEALFDEGRRLGVVPYRVGSQSFHKLQANDDPALDLGRRIKRLLDPDRIVSPGRYNL